MLCCSSGCHPAGDFPSISLCLQEGEAFAAAAALDTHKALVHIFFAQRATKKVKGITDAGGLVCSCCGVHMLRLCATGKVCSLTCVSGLI